MDWKRVTDQARQVIDKRGGAQSLKEDADELRDIAQGPGTLEEKAKQAAEALRDPGAHREPGGPEGGVGEEPPQSESAGYGAVEPAAAEGEATEEE